MFLDYKQMLDIWIIKLSESSYLDIGPIKGGRRTFWCIRKQFKLTIDPWLLG